MQNNHMIQSLLGGGEGDVVIAVNQEVDVTHFPRLSLQNAR